jgi:DNA repair protein RadC
MTKKDVKTQINKLWDAFHSFDYDAYRKVKSTVDLKNPEIASVINRIESHPTWGKNRKEHDTWTAMRDKQEAEAWQRELEYDALHGLHHKHANVFFGKTVLDPEYKKVCDRLGINAKVFIENPTKEEIQAIADHFNCPVVRIRRGRKNPILYGEGGDTGNMILREQKTLEELLGKEGFEKEKREFEERVKKSQSDPVMQADLDRQEREYKKLLEEQAEKPKETPDKKIKIGSFGEEIDRLKKEQAKHSKDLPETFRIEQVIMRRKPLAKINSPEDVVRLMKRMEDHDREHAEVIHLDTKNQVVGIENISTGSINASIVHPRETVKGAVLNNSAAVIFVHNHPSGNPEPSREDLELSKRLKESFKILGIDLLDSVIVGKDGHYSMKEAGTL